eukprot:7362340-Alexandrium_andersonii.AAC.1
MGIEYFPAMFQEGEQNAASARSARTQSEQSPEALTLTATQMSETPCRSLQPSGKGSWVNRPVEALE